MATQKLDVIDVVIEEDGTVTSRVEQDISAENHDAADLFMAELAKLMGGKRTTNKIPHAHHHHHEGQRDHSHAKRRA